MVSESARGPSYDSASIKPDIAAPGASVSAEAGTGSGQTPFGGTSGATPMVSGSAALLIQAHPTFSPLQIKALLLHTAESDIQTSPATRPGVPAPIPRIGAGEVRVNPAFAGRTSAWDVESETPSLSFGYSALTDSDTFSKSVEVHNYSNNPRAYSI